MSQTSQTTETTQKTQTSYAGIAAPLVARVGTWLEMGANEDELLAVLRGTGPVVMPASPAWVQSMRVVGDTHNQRAGSAEEGQQSELAEREYRTAAFYYFLARFPHIMSPQAGEAYTLQRAAYLHASKYFAPALQVISIPFEGKQIVGYLRVPRTPAGAPRPPVVIVSGGIDVWKSDDEIHFVSETLLDAGLATFAMDMPGTGESPIVTAPGAERIFGAAIDYLKTLSLIDGTRAGFYGMSFGGHWAVKLALVNPDIRACVNLSGPVHHTFAPAWLSSLPIGVKANMAVVTGVNFSQVGPQGLFTTLASLSLIEQHLLTPGAHGAALLSITGLQDELVPASDLTVIADQGYPQDTLIFAHDRHVASRHFQLHVPFAARWLRTHL